MAYVNTVAHHTASAAWHAGDPVWIRRANVRQVEGLGFWAAIPALVTAITAIGTAGYQVYQARSDSKDAKKQASKDSAQAAKEIAAQQAEQKRVNDALIAQQQAKTEAEVQSIATRATVVNKFIPAASVAVLGLGVAWFFIRRRRRKK
jgi:uncharacterized protein HemX